MRTEFLHLTVTATAHYTNKKTGLESDLLDITGPRDLMQVSRPLLPLSSPAFPPLPVIHGHTAPNSLLLHLLGLPRAHPTPLKTGFSQSFVSEDVFAGKDQN